MWVRREDLVTGELPPVCVVTGKPSDALARVRLSSLPDWTYLLLFAGVVPFLIALAFAEHRIDALLPVRADVIHRFRRRRFLCWGVALAGLGMFFAGAALTDSPDAPMFGLGIAIVGGVANLLFARTLVGGGAPDRTGTAIRLTRVHPAFASTLRSRQPVT